MAVIEFVDRDQDAKGQDSGPVEVAEEPRPKRQFLAIRRRRGGNVALFAFHPRPRQLEKRLHCPFGRTQDQASRRRRN
jgi:hypothetical protein